jgi:hypothetical protein
MFTFRQLLIFIFVSAVVVFIIGGFSSYVISYKPAGTLAGSFHYLEYLFNIFMIIILYCFMVIVFSIVVLLWKILPDDLRNRIPLMKNDQYKRPAFKLFLWKHHFNN